MEHILLVGTEQVQNAANRMAEASHEMHKAGNSIQDAVYRMETLFDRFAGESLQGFIEDLKKQIDRLEVIKSGNTKDNQ